MNSFDLPDDWSQHALTDDTLVPGVLDLLVSQRDRRKGAVLFALCDARGRLVQPCVIDELPDPMPAEEREAMVTLFVGLLTEFDPPGSLLFAIARGSGLSATQQDSDWLETLLHACEGRVALLGAHIVTSEGSRPLPRSNPAA